MDLKVYTKISVSLRGFPEDKLCQANISKSQRREREQRSHKSHHFGILLKSSHYSSTIIIPSTGDEVAGIEVAEDEPSYMRPESHPSNISSKGKDKQSFQNLPEEPEEKIEKCGYLHNREKEEEEDNGGYTSKGEEDEIGTHNR